ncbi:unnamed protein product [Vicia faba]|uniref:Uncharacterized protein n=1 Tax=Vicia faba TaxID=3906 RepID=A0AAV1AQU0_VICFA|nr:unnamed protein product [Vicia faba]
MESRAATTRRLGCKDGWSEITVIGSFIRDFGLRWKKAETDFFVGDFLCLLNKDFEVFVYDLLGQFWTAKIWTIQHIYAEENRAATTGLAVFFRVSIWIGIAGFYGQQDSSFDRSCCNFNQGFETVCVLNIRLP